MLQGTSGYQVHPKIWLSTEKKCTDKVLLNIRRNFGSITADKKNTMNTCIRRKGKCRHAVIWESGKAKWICLSQEIWADWNSICTFIFWKWTRAAETNHLAQFSSASGLGNEMQLKLRLPPFSLIHAHCPHALCFRFHNLRVNSAQRWRYMIRCIGLFQIPFWGIVLSVDNQGEEKNHWSVCQSMWFLFQSDAVTDLGVRIVAYISWKRMRAKCYSQPTCSRL